MNAMTMTRRLAAPLSFLAIATAVALLGVGGDVSIVADHAPPELAEPDSGECVSVQSITLGATADGQIEGGRSTPEEAVERLFPSRVEATLDRIDARPEQSYVREKRDGRVVAVFDTMRWSDEWFVIGARLLTRCGVGVGSATHEMDAGL